MYMVVMATKLHRYRPRRIVLELVTDGVGVAACLSVDGCIISNEGMMAAEYGGSFETSKRKAIGMARWRWRHWREACQKQRAYLRRVFEQSSGT